MTVLSAETLGFVFSIYFTLSKLGEQCNLTVPYALIENKTAADYGQMFGEMFRIYMCDEE